MAVAVAYVDAGGNVMVVGHGLRVLLPLRVHALDLRDHLYASHRRLRAEHNLGLLIPFGPGLRGLPRTPYMRSSQNSILLGTSVNRGKRRGQCILMGCPGPRHYRARRLVGWKTK